MPQREHRAAGVTPTATAGPGMMRIPWTLLSLPGTWGGTSAQQEAKNNLGLLWRAAKESEVWGGSQQREAWAHGSSANLSPWCPSELWNAGRGLQTAPQNYFISVFPHLCLALGDQMRDRANEGAETFRFKDVLSELFITIFILLWVFQHLSFMRIVDSPSFTLSYLMYCRSFPICSFLLQNLSWESVFDRFREKCPQYFLFLGKNIFKKINVSLINACVCIYNANFPPGLLVHV